MLVFSIIFYTLFAGVCVLLLQGPFSTTSILNQESQQHEYFTATVTNIIDYEETGIRGVKSFTQVFSIDKKDASGSAVILNQGGVKDITPQQPLNSGEKIIVQKSEFNGKYSYSIYDRYRIDTGIMAFIIFLLLIVVVTGKKGVGAIIGLAFSILVIIQYTVPSILIGFNPVVTSIISSLLIACFGMFLAHGFRAPITIAVISTVFSLSLSGVLAHIFVMNAPLSGIGENSFLLQFGEYSINLQGLLIAGIILGSLGVLDDVTTTQAAAVYALNKENNRHSFTELFKRSFAVGREHITSLVNTLALAYIGASITLFLVITVNTHNTPWWVLINSEVIMGEIFRTLAGSFGLVLAVPITTALACWTLIVLPSSRINRIFGRITKLQTGNRSGIKNRKK